MDEHKERSYPAVLPFETSTYYWSFEWKHLNCKSLTRRQVLDSSQSGRVLPNHPSYTLIYVSWQT